MLPAHTHSSSLLKGITRLQLNTKHYNRGRERIEGGRRNEEEKQMTKWHLTHVRVFSMSWHHNVCSVFFPAAFSIKRSPFLAVLSLFCVSDSHQAKGRRTAAPCMLHTKRRAESEQLLSTDWLSERGVRNCVSVPAQNSRKEFKVFKGRENRHTHTHTTVAKHAYTDTSIFVIINILLPFSR